MQLDYEYRLAIRLAALRTSIKLTRDPHLKSALCRQAQGLRRELEVA